MILSEYHNMNEFSHLHESVRQIISLSNQERLKYLYSDKWIGYDRAKNILDLLDDLLNQPIRIRPQSLLIVGEPNIGKTTIIRKFVERHPQTNIEDQFNKIIEVRKHHLLIDAPIGADEKKLYIAILEQFLVAFKHTSPAIQLKHQVVHLFIKFHIRMLIIDEIHNFLTGTPLKQREIMNVLKNLSNELNLSIVGVGAQEAVQILYSDQQHASRFDVAELTTWALDSNFRKLLASYEKLLPLRQPSGLAGKEKAIAIHQISSGNLGDIIRLLMDCTKEAIDSGKENIDISIINQFRERKTNQSYRSIRSINV